MPAQVKVEFTAGGRRCVSAADKIELLDVLHFYCVVLVGDVMIIHLTEALKSCALGRFSSYEPLTFGETIVVGLKSS